MAIGDEAAAAGLPLVPDSGVGGEVNLGAQEINRTRDFISETRAMILPVWPVSDGGTGGTTPHGARMGIGIFNGTAAPSDSVANNVDGSIYFQIVG
jgi:hypothetical protein